MSSADQPGRRARREGQNLTMEVRLTRETRFVGGVWGGCLDQEDDGPLLRSGWENCHNGAVMVWVWRFSS